MDNKERKDLDENPVTLIIDEVGLKLVEAANSFTAASQERERISTVAMLMLNNWKFDTIARLSKEEKIFKFAVLLLAGIFIGTKTVF